MAHLRIGIFEFDMGVPVRTEKYERQLEHQ